MSKLQNALVDGARSVLGLVPTGWLLSVTLRITLFMATGA